MAMGNAIPYRWICNACGQGNAAGVARCAKCNAIASPSSAPPEEAAWNAAVGNDDPAGLQEEWPVHIRWIDYTAISIVFGTLLVFETAGYSLRWLAGFLVAGVFALLGEYAKHVEHRKRVLRYVARLEAAEELAIRRGQKPAAGPDLPDLPGVAGRKRPRLLGGPVLALLSGLAAWILVFEAPFGTLTAIGLVFAGLCATLCYGMSNAKKLRALRAAAAPGRTVARGKRGTRKDNPKNSPKDSPGSRR